MGRADMPGAGEIRCKVHLRSAPRRVFDLLATDDGRAQFWAERTVGTGDRITFHFPNGDTLASRVLRSEPPRLFELTYFDGTTVRFELHLAGDGGTDLELVESGLREAAIVENRAGWVSVLLGLKAWADFGVDLRNHDAARSWAAGFVDN
jgi:uncharacterized protein YndB with AHSA1/START domain